MSQLGNFLWSIADQLRGVYKPAQYGSVILPMTVLRRMECAMEGHREQMATMVAAGDSDERILRTLRRQHGLNFFNRSSYTLASLLGNPDDLGANLNDYLVSFSANVADIFERYGFAKQVAKLDEKDRLYLVVQLFSGVDLNPDRVSNAQMGEVFEHLIYRFSTASNETAGEHFTPRDAIRLMAELLIAPDSELLATAGTVRTAYDPTAGTGGMLSVLEEHILEINPDARVRLFGQELNDESYAICKSDMIGKGQEVESIALGDTLITDHFAGQRFDYCLSNPPYGGDWKAAEAAVRKEALLGERGRFGAGLPRISDGQTLFLQHLAAKMAPPRPGVANSGARAGIVLNGSPLFTGGAGSGESEIRRHFLESDLVDAIIALPTNMFYNTGLATYVWILDNHKPDHRKGKVQLIDATGFFTKLRKNLGSKNREISDSDRDRIVQLYEDFTDGEYSKILESEDFGYWEITVEQPLRLRFVVTPENTEAVMESKPIGRLDDVDRSAIRTTLRSMTGKEHFARNDFLIDLRKALSANRGPASAPIIKTIWTTVGEREERAELCRDAKGNPEPDPELRDTELVPFRDNIQAYFDREVLPHVPGAWIDETKTKIGYEIPFTRLFYKYVPPRPLEEIDAELDQLASDIIAMLRAVESR